MTYLGFHRDNHPIPRTTSPGISATLAASQPILVKALLVEGEEDQEGTTRPGWCDFDPPSDVAFRPAWILATPTLDQVFHPLRC